jgi:hypothetical protein
MVTFDIETLTVLRTALDEAWELLSPVQQARTTKSLVATRLLEAAAAGERDPGRLRDAAINGVAATATT